MKILFVITGLGVGGAERVVVELADALASRGHEVVVAYLQGPALLTPRSPAVRLECLGLGGITDLPAAFVHLGRVVTRFRPDVIHSHLVHANMLARMLRVFVPLPRLITTAHNRYEEGKLRMLAYRLTDRLADISTNVSEEAVAAFVAQKAVRPGRMLTVHNGISTSEFCRRPESGSKIRTELGISASAKVVVAVGRLCEPKDYPNLLAALLEVEPGEGAWEVLIVGDGPLRRQLLDLSDSYGLAHRVRFLGMRRDVPDVLSAADIFVLSSETEGFPMVVGEAMACECMVVATDCGGVKEFVGDTGLLAPVKDPQALAARLRDALSMSVEERARHGSAARRRVQELFSLDATVDKWLALYGCQAVPRAAEMIRN